MPCITEKMQGIFCSKFPFKANQTVGPWKVLSVKKTTRTWRWRSCSLCSAANSAADTSWRQERTADRSHRPKRDEKFYRWNLLGDIEGDDYGSIISLKQRLEMGPFAPYFFQHGPRINENTVPWYHHRKWGWEPKKRERLDFIITLDLFAPISKKGFTILLDCWLKKNKHQHQWTLVILCNFLLLGTASILRQTRASPSCDDEKSRESEPVENQSIQCFHYLTCYKINFMSNVVFCWSWLSKHKRKKTTKISPKFPWSFCCIFSTFFVAPQTTPRSSQISGLGCFKTCSKRTAFPTQHLPAEFCHKKVSPVSYP